VWAADGDMVRAAYSLHAEDDDYGQANTMINKVLDDDQRARLVDNASGAMAAIQREDILQRAFEYWRNIDKPTGEKIEAATLEKRNAAAGKKDG
jgi:catalase